jgi:vancomycin permeability regulator SanA
MRGLTRLLAMCLIGVFVGVSMSTFLYDRRSQEVSDLPSADAALVLAAGINADDTLHSTTKRRVEAGVEVFQAGKVGHILFSGARADPAKASAAELMGVYAHSLGVPDEAILIESGSFSTLQNSLFAKEVLQENGLDDVILVTESYHMGRALVSANWAGIEVVGSYSAGSVFSDGALQGAQLFAREVLATVFNLARLCLWYVLGWFGMSDEERLPMLVGLPEGADLA